MSYRLLSTLELLLWGHGEDNVGQRMVQLLIAPEHNARAGSVRVFALQHCLHRGYLLGALSHETRSY